MSESRPSAPESPTPAEARPEMADAPPPLLGSWRSVYAVVVGSLAAYIVAFWIVTEVYK